MFCRAVAAGTVSRLGARRSRSARCAARRCSRSRSFASATVSCDNSSLSHSSAVTPSASLAIMRRHDVSQNNTIQPRQPSRAALYAPGPGRAPAPAPAHARRGHSTVRRAFQGKKTEVQGENFMDKILDVMEAGHL